MPKTLVDSYNELVPTMNKLVKANNNIDIWEFHDSYRGYGFKVIEKDFYIEVRVTTNYGDNESSYSIAKFKRDGNIFDTFKDKELARVELTGASKVFETINGLYK